MANENNTNHSCPKEIELFNSFIDKFVINHKSVHNDIEFSLDTLDECLELVKDDDQMVMNDSKTEKVSLQSKLSGIETSDPKYQLLWHCYYIMYFMGETAKSFFNLTVNNKDLFVEKGEGVSSTNQVYNSQAIRPFKSLLMIFRALWKNQEKSDPQKVDDVKRIIEQCLPKNDSMSKGCGDGIFESLEIDARVKNVLLYLCACDKYVPIVSQDHKTSIWEGLCFLLDNTKYDESSFITLLETLKGIAPNADKGNQNLNSFYSSSIRPFWKSTSIKAKDWDLPLDTLLTFKKAIVFYGPPGTSKTYTAKELAKEVISKEFVKDLGFISEKDPEKKKTKQELFKNFVTNENKIFGEEENENQLSHIHRLQLHPGYTYDEFIAGKTITVDDQGHTVVGPQAGYLMRLIQEIKSDKDNQKDFCNLPHVVILDEINRVDISRVFGELFSAMEPDYRKTGVEIPTLNNERLIVPDTLYFIGTMNMIDFSLEQIDFALRRRFAWVENTYKESRLKEIIEHKINTLQLSIDVNTIDEYIKRCSKLNQIISEQPYLGPSYQIGHTFYSEVIDIFNQPTTKNKWESAIEIVWSISIKPMIEAYCGTMDTGVREGFIDNCTVIFMHKPNTSKSIISTTEVF